MRDRVKKYMCTECGIVVGVERDENGKVRCSYCGEIIEE